MYSDFLRLHMMLHMLCCYEQKQKNKQERGLQMFQSQGHVQDHAQVYCHAKFECNSLNIVWDIAG